MSLALEGIEGHESGPMVVPRRIPITGPQPVS